VRKKDEYYFVAGQYSFRQLADLAYLKVFRTDCTEPGFVVLDLGTDFSSQQLREDMVRLKKALSQIHTERNGSKLDYQWMGRFDQQQTTKFHLDSAAPQSFLMLGYEPSIIRSRIFFADYMELVQKLGINEEEYFQSYNPVYTDKEQLLKPYVTEVVPFDEKHYKIVLMNNSSSSGKNETIGVLHKAVVENTDLTKERVINSTMLCSVASSANENYPEEQQIEFILTDKVSRNIYE
jgi:hypothetical protein